MEALEAARQICAEAGQILLQRRQEGALGRIDQKQSVTDIVTAVDREVEDHVVRRLQDVFPEHSILTEERGAIDGPLSSHRWILDPLDGTRNYVYGFPFYSVSLGLVIEGQPEIGVVHAPYLREMFWAQRGGGAFLNGEPIQVSTRDQLEASLFSTGFACVRAGLEKNNLPAVRRIIEKSHDLRRAGSAAMDLCYVACGRLDGFWELELSPWDVAAGGLIVAEAGGRITDLSGGPDWMYGRTLISTNGPLHSILMREVHQAWDEGR